MRPDHCQECKAFIGAYGYWWPLGKQWLCRQCFLYRKAEYDWATVQNRLKPS